MVLTQAAMTVYDASLQHTKQVYIAVNRRKKEYIPVPKSLHHLNISRKSEGQFPLAHLDN